MDMNVKLLVKVFFDPQLFSMGAGVAYCRLGRFLHDISQLAGKS